MRRAVVELHVAGEHRTANFGEPIGERRVEISRLHQPLNGRRAAEFAILHAVGEYGGRQAMRGVAAGHEGGRTHVFRRFTFWPRQIQRHFVVCVQGRDGRTIRREANLNRLGSERFVGCSDVAGDLHAGAGRQHGALQQLAVCRVGQVDVRGRHRSQPAGHGIRFRNLRAAVQIQRRDVFFILGEIRNGPVGVNHLGAANDMYRALETHEFVFARQNGCARADVGARFVFGVGRNRDLGLIRQADGVAVAIVGEVGASSRHASARKRHGPGCTHDALAFAV